MQSKLQVFKEKIPAIIYFVQFVKPYVWKELLLILIMFLLSAGTLVSPYVLKIIIDDVFPSKNVKLLLVVLSIYLCISILRIILSYISRYFSTWINSHIVKDIRVSVFERLIKLPLKYHNTNKKGDLIHRVNNEVDSIKSILTSSVPKFINSICTVVGLIVMLSILDYKLLLISLSIFPLIFLNTRYFQPKVHSQVKKSRLNNAAILSFIIERLGNIRLLKSFNTYNHEKHLLTSKVDEQIDINMQLVHTSGLSSSFAQFLTVVLPIMILGIGGADVISGNMSVGVLVAFIQYSNRLFEPVVDIMDLYFDMVRASVSMERIHEVMILPEEKKGATLQNFSLKSKNIRFENVCFAYDAKNILNNLNVIFESGKKYALVGPSGCGKTTLINLIFRFFEPTSGSIYIGDTDLSLIEIEALRRNITLIGQDNQLFHDTIRSNILYGLESGKEHDIDSASTLGRILKDINEMPNGYLSIIGDNGVMISGGEKQRLAIARAFLRNNEIIILDEATSAIDSENEYKIIQNLFTTYPDKTIIIVSHRLSTVRNVDEIICLDNGSVVERGSHDELLSKKSFYWKLFCDQL